MNLKPRGHTARPSSPTYGTIQPFGAVVATDASGAVAYASANCDHLLGLPVDQVLHKPVLVTFGRPLKEAMARHAASASAQRKRLGEFSLPLGTFEGFIHVNTYGFQVLELEPAIAVSPLDQLGPVDGVRRALSEATSGQSVTDMLDSAVKSLRDLTGFDRVMAYRFASNGDAEVLAEARSAHTESYLGLRYSAWDMAQQDRSTDLYSPLRVVADVNKRPAPLLSTDANVPVLNLGLSHLQMPSPAHLNYLKSLGVGACFSIGLIVEGQVWGKLSCHHMTPRLLRADIRMAAEIFGQMISLNIKQQADLAATVRRHMATEARTKIEAKVQDASGLSENFLTLATRLQEIIPCDGVALLWGQSVKTSGQVPSEAAILALSQHRAGERDLILDFENLHSTGLARGAPLNHSAGVLIIRSAPEDGPDLFFFRDDMTSMVRADQASFRNPQSVSWEAFLEQNEGFCQRWDTENRTLARELQAFLNNISKTHTSATARNQDALLVLQKQQDVMLAELNHRVRNTLALIRSLSRQAKASSDSLESYALSLEDRIEALAVAQDLAISSDNDGVSLRRLLEIELGPYLTAGSDHVQISGPPTGVKPDVAPLLALVLHELVSNAAKYGPLSSNTGTLTAEWYTDEDSLHFEWRETGQTFAADPERRGFGRTLVEKAIPFELDGNAHLTFDSSGVMFQASLPAKHLVTMKDEPQQNSGQTDTIDDKAATGLKVLLVEDNMLLAIDLSETLKRLGAKEIIIAASLEEGQERTLEGNFDIAVLDLSLRGQTCFAIADILVEQAVPFAFVSGYNSKVIVPEAHRSVPLLTKPVDEAHLARCLTRLRGVT